MAAPDDPSPTAHRDTAPPDRPGRTLIHTREITCNGYLREDGLWDIEGHILDTKTYPFENPEKGTTEPGMPVHDMVLRLTLDEDMSVRESEARMLEWPFHICREAAPNMGRLEGLKIGKGWRKAVRERLGGTEGCTHLVELLVPLATTAHQSIRPYQWGRIRQNLKPGEEDTTWRRVNQIGSCYAWAGHREVVRRFIPDYYTGDAPNWVDPEPAEGDEP